MLKNKTIAQDILAVLDFDRINEEREDFIKLDKRKKVMLN